MTTMTDIGLDAADAQGDATAVARGGYQVMGFCAEMRMPKAELFRPAQPPPCSESELWVAEGDAWFHDGRYARTVREAAIEVCADCPFRGRCAYNAVASGATHGVWAGIELPGDRPKRLAAYYALLLAKFEERRAEEIGRDRNQGAMRTPRFRASAARALSKAARPAGLWIATSRAQQSGSFRPVPARSSARRSGSAESRWAMKTLTSKAITQASLRAARQVVGSERFGVASGARQHGRLVVEASGLFGGLKVAALQLRPGAREAWHAIRPATVNRPGPTRARPRRSLPG